MILFWIALVLLMLFFILQTFIMGGIIVKVGMVVLGLLLWIVLENFKKKMLN